jgi:hypothetical protein
MVLNNQTREKGYRLLTKELDTFNDERKRMVAPETAFIPRAQ